MLPYRTILRLPAQGDVIQLAQQELQTWLRDKLSDNHRHALASGHYFEPGIHSVGGEKQIRVATKAWADGSHGFLLQLTEPTSNGTYDVSVTAIDNVEFHRRQDSLIIEAKRVDRDAPKDFQVDPPRFVTQLLAREDIYDGQTHVTPAPRIARKEDIEEVYEAIADSRRSVCVIVAASLGREFDEALRERVKNLTAKTVGVTAVFVADRQLVDLLNERLPASHAVEPGRVRTYLPHVDLDDPADGRRHRILGPGTFARAIRGRSVSPGLKAAFADETRSALIAQALPNDIRKLHAALEYELALLDRDSKIVERAQAALSAPEVASKALVAEEPARALQEPWIVRLRQILARWLKREPVVSIDAMNQLDAYIARAEATAETLLEESSVLESRLGEATAEAEASRADRDNLELELAEMQDEASTLRRRVEYLQSKLAVAGEHAAAYSEPELEEIWREPVNAVELVTILSSTAEQAQRHIACERVEFVGDLAPVVELQKRDPIGRYSNAFWQYVQVLYDYVGLRRNGYAGSIHMYLTDDEVLGRKCSPQRHASTESETVLNNSAWVAERLLPVPESVNASGRVLMEAHFKPTHKDTFAPRMHYYDDTANSGKIYIGYVGKHLSNTRTKNA